MPHNHPAASINNSIGWTLPASNTMVDRVYKELNLHPLQKPWGQIVMEWVERQKILAFGILISIITMVIYHFILEYRFNRNRKALELSIFELKEKNTIIEQVQRNLIVNELGSSIAHEINQPLASIKNYAKGLQLRVGNSIDEEELSSILIRIEKQATVASDIVKRLRALIKKHNQEMSLCNPVDFIEESIELVDYEFSKACIEIDCHVFGAPQKVNFDVVGMQQVILNLLNNAKDACIAAGESRTNLKVDVQTYFEKEYIRIVVIDNGIGLGNVDLNAKPAFYSTKSTGLGLGLPICREIIEYHKGTLTINQNQPFGCIATVAIPNDGEIQ
jgi:two-component system sensor histidine kinase TtrS